MSDGDRAVGRDCNGLGDRRREELDWEMRRFVRAGADSRDMMVPRRGVCVRV